MAAWLAALDLEQVQVRRPGLLLPEAASTWCAVAQVPAPPPLAGLRGRAGYGSDRASQPFAWYVMSAAAAIHAGDRAAARGLANTLLAWSAAEALTDIAEVGPGRSNTSALFALKRTLIPLLTAWSLLRPHPDLGAAEAPAIAAWLARLVALADVETGDRAARRRGLGFDCRSVISHAGSPVPISNCQNHRYLRDVINVQWGVLRRDHRRFRRGLAGYATALGQLRPDGSLPLETERGARALWYSRQALSSLVMMAELAALQGVDLYGLEVNGVGIHEAMDFLLGAIGDAARIEPYVRINYAPGPARDPRRQDLGFLRRGGHGRHYMAWIEPYLTRFPERLQARRLARLAGGAILAARPLVDEFAGGNASCFYAGVSPLAARRWHRSGSPIPARW